MATPENPRVRLNTRTLGPFGHRESDPFPPARSRGVQRGSLGPRSRIRARTSGWELESQIRRHPPWVNNPSGKWQPKMFVQGLCK